MIISALPPIQTLLQNLGSVKLNTLLPLEVLVLKQTTPEKYLLQIKNQNVEVTSQKSLNVGETYLTSIKAEPKLNLIKLQHFIKVPLKTQQAIYSVDELISHFKKPSKESISQLHTQLLNNLSQATSKDDFNFYTQLLLGLSQQMISLPFKYRHGFGLLQYKKKKKQEKQSQDEVQFYAYLKHLGPLDGVVTLNGDEITIIINVLFEESQKFLENFKEEFSLTKSLYIRLKEEIKPLFILNEQVLDISI
jgi:hypothetical protein